MGLVFPLPAGARLQIDSSQALDLKYARGRKRPLRDAIVGARQLSDPPSMPGFPGLYAFALCPKTSTITVSRDDGTAIAKWNHEVPECLLVADGRCHKVPDSVLEHGLRQFVLRTAISYSDEALVSNDAMKAPGTTRYLRTATYLHMHHSGKQAAKKCHEILSLWNEDRQSLEYTVSICTSRGSCHDSKSPESPLDSKIAV